MPRTFLVPVDFNKNEIRNPRMQNLATPPSSPVAGQFYYDTDDNHPYMWNGSTWVDWFPAASSGIPASIVDVKGDIIVATAADTVARKAAGSNGTFLQAQSGQSDGLLWTTIADADIPSTIMRDAEHTAASHNAFPLGSLAAPTADFGFGGFKLTNLADPATGTDAANKQYVDAAVAGLMWKDSVRAATTANITISTALNSGDVLDGVTLANGDRVLVKDQSTASQNGIYVVAASPARATDADSDPDLRGMACFVAEGTVNADTAWTLTTDTTPIVVDTTSLAYVQFSGLGQITAGTGMTKSANILNVIAGVGMVANADDMAVLRTDTDGRVPLRYAVDVGNGAATTINVDHNLNSLDVIVQVYQKSDGAQVEPDVTRSTVNRVILTFTTAPTSAQFRCVVYG